MPQLILSIELLESSSDVKLEKSAISWYGVKSLPSSGETIYCGQDVSCLRYLHLPENLDDVHFDLNIRHPDDEFKMYLDKEVEPDFLKKRRVCEDLLFWIKEVGYQDKR
jgi:hypothetical protein